MVVVDVPRPQWELPLITLVRGFKDLVQLQEYSLFGSCQGKISPLANLSFWRYLDTMTRSRSILPHGQVKALALKLGRHPFYISAVIRGERCSYNVALAIDETGMVPFSLLDKYYPRPVRKTHRKAS